MGKSIIYKILIFVFITLITIGGTSCNGNLRADIGSNIIYKGNKYLKIDEPFYYVMDGNYVEIGCIKNYIFPATYVYLSDINDNLLFSPIGSGTAFDNRFGCIFVKEGYDYPSGDTIISSIYLTSYDGSSVYELEIAEKSFNDIFIETEEPAI